MEPWYQQEDEDHVLQMTVKRWLLLPSILVKKSITSNGL